MSLQENKALRLDRLLASNALGSRKEVKQWIREGRLSLHGQVLTRPETAIAPSDWAAVRLDGELLQLGDRLYFMLHKPTGYLSAMEARQQACLAELVPENWRQKHIAPVGRLDRDSSGLLLLTNDGQLAHRLLSPRWGVWKYYRFHYAGEPLGPAEVEACAQGLDLGDFLTRPALLRPLAPGLAELTVHEGKFHQVRRMVQKLGREIQDLHRWRQGPLELGELELGSWRPLTEAEVQALRACCAEKPQGGSPEGPDPGHH